MVIQLYSQKSKQIDFSIINHLITNQLNQNTYINSQFKFKYMTGIWSFGASYFSNPDQRFSIFPEPIELSSPDITNIVNLDEFKFNPDRYIVSTDFRFDGSIKINTFIMALDVYRVLETNLLETVSVNGNALIVRPSASKNQQFLSDMNFQINGKNLNFATGLRQLNLYREAKHDLSYQIKLNKYPYVGITYHRDEYKLKSEYNKYFWKFGLRKRFVDSSLSFSTSIGIGQKNDLTQFGFSIEHEFSSSFSALMSFHRDGNNLSMYNREKFLNHLKVGHRSALINNTNISLGFNYHYSEDQLRDKIEVEIYLKNEPIFLSKQIVYQRDAFGEVTLLNLSDAEIEFYLELRSDDGFIQYKTDFFKLSANDTLQIPLYIYMNTANIEKRKVQKSIEVNLIGHDQSTLIYQKNVDLYDRNYWNGKPADLLNFLQSANQTVRNYAVEIYRNTDVVDSNFYSEKFSRFKQFISTIAIDKRYVTDQVYSIYVDEVQYPDQLIISKTGDCEDLLVFYMSALMSIGHQSAIIALKPKPEQTIGHVFLLVDSGIPVIAQGQLNLTDIGVIKRQNYLGNYTLWLPIEVTILDQGFDVAYKSGIRQYYDELILKQGIQNHTVEVIDIF